jgi:hypothetical protein
LIRLFHSEVYNMVIVCEKIFTIIILKEKFRVKVYNISTVSCNKNYFKLSSSGENIPLKFETMEGKLQSLLTFT